VLAQRQRTLAAYGDRMSLGQRISRAWLAPSDPHRALASQEDDTASALSAGLLKRTSPKPGNDFYDLDGPNAWRASWFAVKSRSRGRAKRMVGTQEGKPIVLTGTSDPTD